VQLNVYLGPELSLQLEILNTYQETYFDCKQNPSSTSHPCTQSDVQPSTNMCTVLVSLLDKTVVRGEMYYKNNNLLLVLILLVIVLVVVVVVIII
jgi:hypothetical protein